MDNIINYYVNNGLLIEGEGLSFIDDIIKGSIAIFVIGIFIWMMAVLGDITQQDVIIPIALLVLIGAIIGLGLIITIIKVLR